MSYNNPLANTSYTNRDFNTIYPELLDLVKKLTYKWDPSISNESDPGVILLKLNALVADKCNYNMDKNVLECFPLSVTQEANARQLYAQLGYYMHWYQSATTIVNMTWVNFKQISDSNAYCIIPKFTMVTDSESNAVYTLVGPGTDNDVVSDQKLNFDGSTISWRAMQGVPVVFSIEGEELITPDLLDEDNRIYFDSSQIAQNGIFITHSDQEDYHLWKQCDNLLVEKTDVSTETSRYTGTPTSTVTYYYSFGVLPNSNTCYIEFPENATDVLKGGIKIVYLETEGDLGNISAGHLTKFYSDLTVNTNLDNNVSIILSSSNVKLQNTVPGLGGKDKESLKEAYKGHQRTIGTYNTLITLRDYVNACLKSGYASNAFVTSRQNDPQCVYKIVSYINGADTTLNIIEKDAKKPILNAFDLKLYVLQDVASPITSSESYDKSFELTSEDQLYHVTDYLADQKSIEHDFCAILPPKVIETNGIKNTNVHLCMLRNKFSISARITPTYALSDLEKEDLITHIKEFIYERFSAKNLDFGAEITAADINDLLLEADSRISTVSNVIAPSFEPYAVYWNGEEFKEVSLLKPYISNWELRQQISTSSEPLNEEDYNTEYLISASPQIFLEGIFPKSDLASNLNADLSYWGRYQFKYSNEEWYVRTYFGNSDIDFSNPESDTGYKKISTYKIIDSDSQERPVQIDDLFGRLSGEDIIGAQTTDILRAGTTFATITVEVNPVKFIKEDILLKSILAGTTPLLDENNVFKYDLNHDVQPIQPEQPDVSELQIQRIQANLNLTVEPNKILKLKENEVVRVYLPSLSNGDNYSNYVKFDTNISTPVKKDTAYQIKDGEYIIFYWKDTDKDIIYNYRLYSKGNIITPSFNLDLAQHEPAAVTKEIVGTNATLITDIAGYLNDDNSYKVDNQLSWNTTVLTGTKNITIRHITSLRLMNGGCKFTWILNSVDTNYNYVLFPKGESEYILGPNEYFIYIRNEFDAVQILGAGTKIVRDITADGASDIIWKVPATSRETFDISKNNYSELSWYDLAGSKSEYVEITEQELVTLSAGTSIYIDGTESLHLDSQSTILNAEHANTTIYYSTSNNPSTTNLNSTEWTKISPLSIDGHFRTIQAHLLLNVSPAKGQFIESNHKINVQIANSNEIVELQAGNYLKSSFPISAGLTDGLVDVSKKGAIKKTEYPKVMTYKLQSDYISSSLDGSSGLAIQTYRRIYPSSGGCVLYFYPAGNAKYPDEYTEYADDFLVRADMPIKLPKNLSTSEEGYILPLYIPTDLDFLDISVGNPRLGYTNLPFFNTDTTTNMCKNIKAGMYYIDLNIPAVTNNLNEELLLLFTLGTNITRTKMLVLGRLFKWKSNKDILKDEQFTFTDICNKLKTFYDLDNQFNYTYSIPEDKRITDPLDGLSLFNTNHVYNKITIGQLDTDKQILMLVGK